MSTVTRLLLGLTVPTAGQVILGEQEITGVKGRSCTICAARCNNRPSEHRVVALPAEGGSCDLADRPWIVSATAGLWRPPDGGQPGDQAARGRRGIHLGTGAVTVEVTP